MTCLWKCPLYTVSQALKKRVLPEGGRHYGKKNAKERAFLLLDNQTGSKQDGKTRPVSRWDRDLVAE